VAAGVEERGGSAIRLGDGPAACDVAHACATLLAAILSWQSSTMAL
jgi:hypothetical protein